MIVSPTQLATELQNLTEDNYEYRIDVVDNNGATAFDTIKLTRRTDYEIDLLKTYEFFGGEYFIYKFLFKITPSINPLFNLLIKGEVRLITYSDVDSNLIIRKNGVEIFRKYASQTDLQGKVGFEIGYISTDVIEFELLDNNIFPDLAFVFTEISLNEVVFVNGFGNVVGLPETAP